MGEPILWHVRYWLSSLEVHAEQGPRSRRMELQGQRDRSISLERAWYAWMVPWDRHARFCPKLCSL